MLVARKRVVTCFSNVSWPQTYHQIDTPMQLQAVRVIFTMQPRMF